MEPNTTSVLPYASPVTGKPRVTFRGAIITLIVGGGLLVLGVVLLIIAWAIFRNLADVSGYRAQTPLEYLGTFTCVVAGFFFLVGTFIVFLGLRGARERSMD